MKKIVLVLGLSMMLLMTGCGGGGNGSGSAGTNNAALATGQNELGYYGKNVIFGDFAIASRGWGISSPQEQHNLQLLFSADGQDVLIAIGIDLSDGIYGVSNDGHTLTISDYIDKYKIQIVSSQSEYCYSGTFSKISTGQIMDVTICAAQ